VISEANSLIHGWHTLLSWKIPEVSNVGGARTKNIGFPISCTQPIGKVSLQTNGTNGKYTLKGTYWRSQPTRYQELQMGNPKLKEFQELFFHSIRWQKKIAEFCGTISFQMWPKMGEISQANCVHGRLQAQCNLPKMHHKCTITRVIYNGSLWETNPYICDGGFCSHEMFWSF